MPHVYSGPGDYVAICNNPRFDGHYVRTFAVPDTEEWQDVSAAWYFLNRVNFVACLEAVYPAAIFADIGKQAK